MASERDIEQQLRRVVRSAGGECLKWVSPGYTGVPDRIILAPGGRIAFAETKAPGRAERPRQRHVQQRLIDLGFVVFSSVDSLEKIGEVVKWVMKNESRD